MIVRKFLLVPLLALTLLGGAAVTGVDNEPAEAKQWCQNKWVGWAARHHMTNSSPRIVLIRYSFGANIQDEGYKYMSLYNRFSDTYARTCDPDDFRSTNTIKNARYSGGKVRVFTYSSNRYHKYLWSWNWACKSGNKSYEISCV